MKLQTIEIYDFKSIKHEKVEILSNQLCLVGKNESGKSSILQAISYLNILDTEFSKNLLNKSSSKYPDGFPVIIGTFQISSKTYEKLYEILVKYLETEDSQNIPKISENCMLQIKRWGNGISNISISIIEAGTFGLKLSNIKEKAKFYNAFFSKVYPIIHLYANEELLIEPSSIENLNGKSNKYETFRKLLVLGGCKTFSDLTHSDINFATTYLSNIEHDLNVIFKRHYKQDNSISLKITLHGDKFNLIIRDNSERSFSINERSPGFQYYFSFLVNKLYSNKINEGKNTIVLLDEPGNNLHPQGAKDLLKSFDEIAESSQILYTTHNPFLAVRNCIDSLIFVDKSATQGTKVKKKAYLNKYQVLRKELGIMLNDSFLIGDVNLIVEGNTEKLAFHRLFQFEKYQNLEWLNIYNADGVANIPQAINYLGKNNLKLRGIVILDSDGEAENIKKKKTYKSNIEEPVWNEIEINSVFKDEKTRTFEDLFPQEIYVGAFNKYCEGLKNLEVFDKEYIPYNISISKPIEIPIIDELSKYFKTFLPQDSKSSITKQDVIRNLLDYTDTLESTKQEEVLNNVFKLLDKIQQSFQNIEQYVSNEA